MNASNALGVGLTSVTDDYSIDPHAAQINLLAALLLTPSPYPRAEARDIDRTLCAATRVPCARRRLSATTSPCELVAAT